MESDQNFQKLTDDDEQPTYQSQNNAVVYNTGPGRLNHQEHALDREYIFEQYLPTRYTGTLIEREIPGISHAVEVVDKESIKYFHAFFTFFRFVIDPCLNFAIAALSLCLHVIEKILVGFLPIVLDGVYKPLWHIVFNFVLNPLGTFLFNVFQIINTMTSAHNVLNGIVNAICRILSSFRLFHYHTGGKEVVASSV